MVVRIAEAMHGERTFLRVDASKIGRGVKNLQRTLHRVYTAIDDKEVGRALLLSQTMLVIHRSQRHLMVYVFFVNPHILYIVENSSSVSKCVHHQTRDIMD